jgi:hypothetical protein
VDNKGKGLNLRVFQIIMVNNYAIHKDRKNKRNTPCLSGDKNCSLRHVKLKVLTGNSVNENQWSSACIYLER